MLFLSPSIFGLNLNLQYLLIFNAFRQLVVRIPFLVCKLPVIQVLATVGINSMAFPWGCFFWNEKEKSPKNPWVVRSNKAMCDRWVGWWLGWVEHWSTLILVVTPPKLDPENWWDWKTPFLLGWYICSGSILNFRWVGMFGDDFFFWCWCLIVGWRSIIWGPVWELLTSLLVCFLIIPMKFKSSTRLISIGKTSLIVFSGWCLCFEQKGGFLGGGCLLMFKSVWFFFGKEQKYHLRSLLDSSRKKQIKTITFPTKSNWRHLDCEKNTVSVRLVLNQTNTWPKDA